MTTHPAPSILLSSPDAGELEQQYVMRAMQSGWVAPAGPDLTASEGEIAQGLGTHHVTSLSDCP